ncbi:choline-binding transcriptional repressor BetI [Pararhizobium mangrovi]|uniref:HTH-type transcriptional regulator BetI n=1 Tax=Pararhizobium mangrovi TaxID=2590452 RepID=A0A506UBG2_9HYPH|nr:transcriptional regulator BetI [Pararhizobium mangrovi]TPW31280.1 transcriptional regulator BetI [Pararhizobium mangrovi]
MPKLGMESVRRRSLVEATISAIHTRGSMDVTMREIATRAGVSLGLAHHYFANKDDLLTSAMRAIMTDYRTQVGEALAGADGPHERVRAIIRASLAQDQFNPEVVSAWLVFYAHAHRSPRARRILSIYTRRLHSNLCHELRQLVGERADGVAAGLAALIDGLYVREGLGTARMADSDAYRLLDSYVSLQIAAGPAKTASAA